MVYVGTLPRILWTKEDKQSDVGVLSTNRNPLREPYLVSNRVYVVHSWDHQLLPVTDRIRSDGDA